MVYGEGLSAAQVRNAGFSYELRIDTDPSTGNAKSAWRLLESESGFLLSEVQKDILDIASCLYVADRHSQRESGSDAVRDLRVLIGLRRPDKFDPTELSRLLRNLSLDRISFTIEKRKRDKKGDSRDRSEPVERDVVCLLSGGVDSFGGAIEACEKNRNPILLSHYTSDANPQLQLMHSLDAHYQRQLPGILVGNLQTAGRGLAGRPVESSMRLRSFLYLALASTVATAVHAKEIWMSENGIMTPGIPFSPSRVGPYTTRTTHPVFVEEFSGWYSRLLGQPLTVYNPFAYSTKSEIIRRVSDAGFAEDLRGTVSCFRRQYAVRHGSNHCGYCVPCLIRRVSFLSAGMDSYDDPSGYLTDCFDLDAIPQGGLADVADLALFSTNFDQMPEDALRFNYVELYDLREGTRIERTIETLKRFAHEFLDVLSRQAKPNLKAALGI